MLYGLEELREERTSKFKLAIVGAASLLTLGALTGGLVGANVGGLKTLIMRNVGAFCGILIGAAVVVAFVCFVLNMAYRVARMKRAVTDGQLRIEENTMDGLTFGILNRCGFLSREETRIAREGVPQAPYHTISSMSEQYSEQYNRYGAMAAAGVEMSKRKVSAKETNNDIQ